MMQCLPSRGTRRKFHLAAKKHSAILRAAELSLFYATMNIQLLKFFGAFLAGTAATAGVVRLIYWAPLPSYLKPVLAFVVTLPSVLIALVLVYYGPGAETNATELRDLITPRELLSFFLYGCLVPLGYGAIRAVWRMALPLKDRGDDSADSDE